MHSLFNRKNLLKILTLTSVFLLVRLSFENNKAHSLNNKYFNYTNFLDKILIDKSEQQNRSAWDKIKDLFRRNDSDGGSRGENEYCPLTPSTKSFYLRNSTPLFIFFDLHSKVKRVEIYPHHSDTPIWQHQITLQEEAHELKVISYDGPALEPGVTYIYVPRQTESQEPITDDEKAEKNVAYFRIMPADAQSEIQVHLNKIAQEYEDINDVILESTEYLLSIRYSEREGIVSINEEESGLAFDAIQQLFSTDSPHQSTYVQDLREIYCKEEESIG